MNEIHHLDSTSDAALTLIEKHGPIGAIVTDPPFGMEYQSNSATTPEGRARNKKIDNDGDVDTAIGIFHDCIRPTIPLMAEDCDIYIFTAWHVLDAWIPAVKAIAPGVIELKMMLLWDKGDPGQGDLLGNWG